jgi:hypothetical protein
VKFPAFDNAHLNLASGASNPSLLTRVTDFACDQIPVVDTEGGGDRNNLVYHHLSDLQSGETARCESWMPQSPQKDDGS